MTDDDDKPVRLVPRDDWDRLLSPTDAELLHSLDREVGELADQIASLQADVAALMKPQVEAIHPQNPWRLIAKARVRLAEMRDVDEIDDATFREAMDNLAASERQLDASMTTADAIVADLDERRRGD